VELQIPIRLRSGQALGYARDDKGEGHASMCIRRLVERTAGPSTSLRSGRDDNSYLVRERVPNKNGNPKIKSQTLGMTRGRATPPWRAVARQKAFFFTLGESQTHEPLRSGWQFIYAI
jgi:hypothetical protein